MSASPYTVALVLDPTFGQQLFKLSERLHVWAVNSPANQDVAEQVWANGKTYSNEYGITTFLYDANGDAEKWCIDIIDTLDDHHNIFCHTSEYTVLEVYGLEFNENIVKPFSELGFVSFEKTDYGFLAYKRNLTHQSSGPAGAGR